MSGKNTSIDHIFTDAVASMSAYHVPNSGSMIKLDAMELPYKLPDEMRQSLGAVLSLINVNRYPNPKSSSLVAKIKAVFSVPETCEVILGNGSDELIQIILQATMRPNSAVMAVSPSFVMYKQMAEMLGMRYIGIDLQPDFSIDERAFLSAIEKELPSVIFLAYPNNPTATLLRKEFVEAVCNAAPGLVVIDEAYTAYIEEEDMLNSFALASSRDNVIVLRTLSKIGLAGIRLGYMVGNPPLVAQFNKVRMPYNINLLTQATARFVLDQKLFLDDCVRKVLAEKRFMVQWLQSRDDVVVYPSHANFVLVRFHDSTAVFARLRDEFGILVKNMHGVHPVLDNVLRITIGDERQNKAVCEALTQILGHK